MRRVKETHSFFFFFFVKKGVYVYFWWCCRTCRFLVPQPGIKPVPPAVEAWSLNHWARNTFLIKITYIKKKLEKLSTQENNLKKNGSVYMYN